MHNLSHPGVRFTVKVITDRFVWFCVVFHIKDYCSWARSCLQCQKYDLSNSRFEHVNIDIVGSLPISDGSSYYLSCIDCYSRWFKIFFMVDMSAETVARTLLNGWILRLGFPFKITTDKELQFQSILLREMELLLGIKHPASNVIIERRHRELNAGIKCYEIYNWCTVLRLILLGMRKIHRTNLNAVPDDLLVSRIKHIPQISFVKNKKIVCLTYNRYLLPITINQLFLFIKNYLIVLMCSYGNML